MVVQKTVDVQFFGDPKGKHSPGDRNQLKQFIVTKVVVENDLDESLRCKVAGGLVVNIW